MSEGGLWCEWTLNAPFNSLSGEGEGGGEGSQVVVVKADFTSMQNLQIVCHEIQCDILSYASSIWTKVLKICFSMCFDLLSTHNAFSGHYNLLENYYNFILAKYHWQSLWLICGKHPKFAPSTRVFPLSIISQVQIHLLYHVKLCQNRPKSPANNLRALNINRISCQSFGCIPVKHNWHTVFQTIEYSDVYSASHQWDKDGTSNRELHHPEQEALCSADLGIFLQLSVLQWNNALHVAASEAMGPHEPAGWEMSQLQMFYPAESRNITKWMHLF